MAVNIEKRFKQDIEYRKTRIIHLGTKYHWFPLKYNQPDNILSFANKEAILTINIVNLIVQTEIIHPKKGETKLIRSGNFNCKLIERIFDNPRAHMPPSIISEYK